MRYKFTAGDNVDPQPLLGDDPVNALEGIGLAGIQHQTIFAEGLPERLGVDSAFCRILVSSIRYSGVPYLWARLVVS